MKKTAMQQHIEWLRANLEISQEHAPSLANIIRLSINDAEQKLKLEKEQLFDAWDNGWHEHINPTNSQTTSAQYYKETFKSKEK